MGSRGRKSAAELLVLPSVRLASAYDPQPPAQEPSPPPEHLQPATKAWWASIVYELEEFSCTCCRRLRSDLVKHGLTYEDPKGMIRPRPEAAIARDARTSFLRAVRELKLDVPEPKPRRMGGIGVTWEQLRDERSRP